MAEPVKPSKSLSAAQKRHLAEMVTDSPIDPPMYWTTRRGTAQHRCALALVRKGLLVDAGDHSSWSFNNPGFLLTEDGLAAAQELAQA